MKFTLKSGIRFGAAMIALALIVGACSSQGTPVATNSVSDLSNTPTSAGNSITIQRFELHPQRISIPVGTSVTWTNMDQILHTVTEGSPNHITALFDGNMPQAGSRFTYTFSKRGTFTYFCRRHATVDALKGVITVT